MQHKPTGSAFLRFIGRFFAFIGTTALTLVIIAVGFCWVLCKGPSPTARDAFVNAMYEHQTLQFIPSLFLSDEEINTIITGGIPIESVDNEEVGV